MIKNFMVIFLVVGILSGCDKPKHYYMTCGEDDSGKWKLVGSKIEDGYITECHWSSYDGTDSYIGRCTETGCD